MSRSRRFLTLLVPGVALVLAATVGPASSPGSQAAVPEAAQAPVAAAVSSGPTAPPRAARLVTSSAHPFSNPIYFPVRQLVRMDCYRGNPGCRPPDTDKIYHSAFQLTLNLPRGARAGGVYAMGAGIVRRTIRGDRCGGRPRANLGNQVVIDHGGGTESRYGHLRGFAAGIRPGVRVAAGQRIGTIGNSGAAGRGPSGCNIAYLDFFVQRMPGFRRVQFKTLRACVDGTTQTWPRAQHPRYPTFNELPKDYWRRGSYRLPHVRNPGDVPDASCLSARAPATPDRPSTPRLVNAGSGRLKASWAGQPGRTSAVVEVQHFRRGSRTWQKWQYLRVPAGRTSIVLTARNGLRRGGLTRVFVSYRNGAGLSAPSRPAARTTR